MRAGFRMILEAAGIEVVGEAATGAEAVAAASALHPDVVCMDVQMPDLDGIEATRRIVADPSVAAAVVIVTTFDRDDYLFEALSAGASGFLLKNAGPEELVSAVRVAAAGEALLAPEVTRRVIARFAAPGLQNSFDSGPSTPGQPGSGPAAADLEEFRSSGADHPDQVRRRAHAAPPAQPSRTDPRGAPDLTEREMEVLRLVAQAMSNAEIAARLYIGEATVKTHVSNVLQKLGVRDRVAAVVYAHSHGLA
ncbi:response regulator [Microbacterium sp. BWT-B31]|uniref:response regulator n=1 Tax=Microbacterium sp. BWT-B31 TaxID=3232072 RepID=UPI003527E4AC